MNYDQIILEMLDRIKNLERSVIELQERYINVNDFDLDKNDKPMRKVLFNKSVVIDDLMSESKEHGAYLMKANRRDGGGVITSSGKKFMLKLSKNYVKNSDYKFDWRSWFTVNAEDVNEHSTYDGFIFAVQSDIYSEKINFFILSKDDMRNIIRSKEIDNQNRYHFYISKVNEGGIFEIRDIPANWEQYLDNWEILRE